MPELIGSVGWWTPPVGANVGYGYAAVEAIQALQRAGVGVWFKDTDAKSFINFVQPDFYEGIYDQFRIGYTPWESSEIPKHWIPRMQEMDEIWTTSNYCKEIFEKYDVNDIIRVVPHGIDNDVWKVVNRYEPEDFYFLHVGGPTARKGAQRVVDAFLDLYEGNEHMFLVLKTHDESEARATYNGQFGNAGKHPQIIVINQDLDVYDLAALYARCHCLVYPTNGEGFGLIPFQGIASGMPTICTNATGCADFASFSVPLDSTPIEGIGIHLGMWVEPSPDHLREQMTYVVENYDKVAERTVYSARILHNNSTWDHVAQQIIGILGEHL